jgi:predicted Ser/Thr protein kinase
MEETTSPSSARVWKRPALFLGYTLLFAAPLWALASPFLLWLLDALAGEGRPPGIGQLLLLAGGGILLNVPANILLRIAESRPRWRPTCMAAQWLLAAAWWWGACWVSGWSARSVAAVPGISLAALLFWLTHHLRERRRRRRLNRLSCRLTSEAADTVSDHAMPPAGPDAMDTIVAGQVPTPLPVALNYLKQSLKTMTDIRGVPCKLDLESPGLFPEDRFIEPALLCAASRFAALYGAHHRNGGIRLEPRLDAAGQTLLLQTDLKKRDLWFVLPEGSPVWRAREALVNQLNQLDPPPRFEARCDSSGYLQFHLALRTDCAVAPEWDAIEQSLGEPAHLLSTCELSSGGNRVYQAGQRILKVERAVPVRNKRLNLAEEAMMLRRLAGLPGVPQRVDFVQHPGFSVLSYDRIEGESLDRHLQRHKDDPAAWFRCLVRLTALLDDLHARGVAHRDLRPDNILVQPDGGIALIDFDQAALALGEARSLDFEGTQLDDLLPCIPFPTLLRTLGLEVRYRTAVEQLECAWKLAQQSNASSPGTAVAYYAWRFGGLTLPGERPWNRRWRMIQPAIAPFLAGARILDLGCNLGLLPLHLKHTGGGQAAGRRRRSGSRVSSG